MGIQKLELSGFRNYDSACLNFNGRVIALCGDNGQGKTNILEALHFITQGYSFRTPREKEMISWGAPQAFISLEGVSEQTNSTVQLSLGFNIEERRIRVNGKESASLSDLIGKLPLVAIVPEDLILIQGAPLGRRRFLDALLCQCHPEYLIHLKRYNRVVRQRNAFLKTRPNPHHSLWEVLNEQFTESAHEVFQTRFTALKELEPQFQNLHQELSLYRESLNLHYQTFPGAWENPSQYKLSLLEKIRKNQSAEIEKEQTLWGPHRDDLVFSLFEKSLKTYGSKGQCRTAALALKIAASDYMARQLNTKPIFLMDDIFAELDDHRKGALGEFLKGAPQVFIATPHPKDLPFRADSHYQVNSGKIHQQL